MKGTARVDKVVGFGKALHGESSFEFRGGSIQFPEEYLIRPRHRSARGNPLIRFPPSSSLFPSLKQTGTGGWSRFLSLRGEIGRADYWTMNGVTVSTTSAGIIGAL